MIFRTSTRLYGLARRLDRHLIRRRIGRNSGPGPVKILSRWPDSLLPSVPISLYLSLSRAFARPCRLDIQRSNASLSVLHTPPHPSLSFGSPQTRLVSTPSFFVVLQPFSSLFCSGFETTRIFSCFLDRPLSFARAYRLFRFSNAFLSDSSCRLAFFAPALVFCPSCSRFLFLALSFFVAFALVVVF